MVGQTKSQVDGVLDMVPACCLCGSVGERLRKRTIASSSTFVWEKAASTALALMLDNSVSPCMLLMPSICCSSAGAQREWIQVSLCLGPFRGISYDSITLSSTSQSPLLFAVKSYGDLSFWQWNTVLGGACCGAEVPYSQDIPLNFWLPHMGVGLACSVSPPFLPISMWFLL